MKVIDANGNLKVIGDSGITALENGLTLDGTTGKLGGTLIEDTTISGAYDLTIQANDLNITATLSMNLVAEGAAGLELSTPTDGGDIYIHADDASSDISIVGASGAGITAATTLSLFSDSGDVRSNYTAVATPTELTGRATGSQNEIVPVDASDSIVPLICEVVQLTARTAAIGATNFANASATGLYRASFYLHCTTADITAGTITLSITYNDGTATRTLTSLGVLLTSTANKENLWSNTDLDGTLIQHVTGTSVAYSTALTGIIGTADYALYMVLERFA